MKKSCHHTEYLLEKVLTDTGESSPYEFRDGEIYRGREHLGSFRLLPYSDGTVYFHSFSIDRPGQGTGRAVFPHLLNFLAHDYKKIRLQVSSDNTAAMKLYQDFAIVEQAEV